MKVKLLTLLLLCTGLAIHAHAASTNAAGDSIKVVDKQFLGEKTGPGSSKLGSISIKIQVEAVLKSAKSATLRAGATLKNEREIETLFVRPITDGKLEMDIPLSIRRPKGKALIVVVWIDPNPEETNSPPRPIVFEKFGFDLSNL